MEITPSRLFKAAQEGDIATVKELVRGGVSINDKDDNGQTALMRAAVAGFCGHVDVVRYLVEQKADKEVKDYNGRTALMVAARRNHVDVVQYLVEQGADVNVKDNYGNTALITAVRDRYMSVAQCLFEQSADREVKKYGWTKLTLAAFVGNLKVVQYLIKQGADKDAKNNEANTALIEAIRNRHVSVARYLVEQGADVNVKDKYGNTVLFLAATYGHVDVVRYLVEQEADIESRDNEGSTVMMDAALNGNVNVVQYLVDHGADKEAKDNDGRTALILASQEGYTAVTKYLIEKDADVNAKNNNGTTALMVATRYYYVEVVQYLVEHGADVNIKDKCGDTALIVAAQEGHVNVVKYLVDHGAYKDDKDKSGRTALMWAASAGSVNMMQYLIEQGYDKEAKDNDENTALINAASFGRLDMVEFLVMQGVDKEANNNDGYTALISAASCGHLDVVECLVMQGVDASRLDNQGNSVLLHLLNLDADEDKILQPAKLLLEYGAPPLQSNKQGYSAKSIAKVKGYHHISALVKECADKPPRQSVFRVEPVVENRNWLISVNTVRRVILPLAEGSFGKVYRAKWSHNDVVVKEIEIKTEAEMNRFRREVSLWRGLTHPNIVQLFGANDREPPYFMVSKYASNEILCKYLSSEKAEGRTVVWQKLFQVAAGLSYLHLHDIVHGDLKGNNIVVSNDGTAMLTDFGLSFLETASSNSVQKMKDTLGAMQWRAPEYAMMTVEKPTRKSDVYSLGMCIIEAVIGTTPWGVGFHSNVIREILRRNEVKIKKPGEMTDDQWVLVSRMIAYEPKNRPDMEDVLSELETFAETEKKNEAARQVVSKVQVAHDADVHGDIGDGAAEDQSGGTHRTPAQTSTASTNWSNRKSVSTSF